VVRSGSARRGRGRRLGVRLLVSLLAIAAGAGVHGVASADAALDIKWYSFEPGHHCQDPYRVDPVTVIFWYLAYPDWTSNHIYHHTGWGDNYDPQGQQFVTNNWCNMQHGSQASSPFYSDRYHIRWRGGTYADATFQYFSLGTPHYEARIGNCHAAYPTSSGWSGFDAGRQQIWDSMTNWGGHYSYFSYVGNSAPKAQCNGWVAQSNGNALYMRIDNA